MKLPLDEEAQLEREITNLIDRHTTTEDVLRAVIERVGLVRTIILLRQHLNLSFLEAKSLVTWMHTGMSLSQYQEEVLLPMLQEALAEMNAEDASE